MKKILGKLVLGLVISAFLYYSGPVHADSDLAVGGSASVDLDFQIQIPTILFLQVGTIGATIDTISFSVTDIPGTGAVAGASSGANPVPVRAAGFVGSGSTMTLTADSSTALTDGANTIPFSEISWTATGDFAGGTFSDAAAQQLDQFTGPGNRTGTYSFSYDNDTYYPASTYDGTVSYTLSSP
ncbi:MAG: hypothetical protein GY849_23775 [Deltaproteobacteria bacterium]|nr:hypothetical protein [Deltaproteobacteria bacterium]